MAKEQNYLDKKAKDIKEQIKKDNKSSLLKELDQIKDISRKTIIMADKSYKENKKDKKEGDDDSGEIEISF